MERIFALYDSDVFYATRFLEYFKKKKDFGFKIAVFTSKESLDEYLQSYPVEILLLGDQVSEEDINYDRVRHICKLSDKLTDSMGTGFPRILKYQAAQSVMSDVMSVYHQTEKEAYDSSSSNHTKIVLVYSPIPKLETALFTWSAGSLLAEHKKVLLVLLELLPVRVLNSADNMGQRLSEVIYYLKESKDFVTKMNSLIVYHGNMPYLGGTADGTDVLAISREDMQNWAAQLRDHTDYQTILFYTEGYSEALTELLDISDTILLAGMESVYDKALFGELMRQRDKTGIGMNREKLLQITLPEEDGISHLPVSPIELTYTKVWNYTKENLGLL